MSTHKELTQLFKTKKDIVALPPDSFLIDEKKFAIEQFIEYIQHYFKAQNITFIEEITVVSSSTGYFCTGIVSIDNQKPVIFSIVFPAGKTNEFVSDIKQDYPELFSLYLDSFIEPYLDKKEHLINLVLRFFGEIMKAKARYPDSEIISIGIGTRLYKDSKKVLSYPDTGMQISFTYFQNIDYRIVVYVAEKHVDKQISEYMYYRHNLDTKASLRYQETPTFEITLQKTLELFHSSL